MSEQEKKLDGPDFAQGVPFGDLAEGSMIVGATRRAGRSTPQGRRATPAIRWKEQ